MWVLPADVDANLVAIIINTAVQPYMRQIAANLSALGQHTNAYNKAWAAECRCHHQPAVPNCICSASARSPTCSMSASSPITALCLALLFCAGGRPALLPVHGAAGCRLAFLCARKLCVQPRVGHLAVLDGRVWAAAAVAAIAVGEHKATLHRESTQDREGHAA